MRGRQLPIIGWLVRNLLFQGWLSLAAWSAVAANPAYAPADAPPGPRILVVYETDATLPASIEMAQGLRAGFEKGIRTKFETYNEYLDLLRFSGSEDLERRAADMAAKYGKLSIDVVVAMGPGALKFALEHRDSIAPGAPLVFGAVSENSVRGASLPRDTMGVVSAWDAKGTIALARRLQPDARRIVVLSGSSDFDRSWDETARRDLGDLASGIEVTYLSGLAIGDFIEEVRRLSRDTILLILTVTQDAKGNRYIPREVVQQLSAESGAPAYGVYNTYVGFGIVGGYVDSFASMAGEVASLSTEALAGNISSGKLVTSQARSVVDWAQMARWGLDQNLLPADAAVENYEPSVWEQYRLEILATAAVMLLQSATIAALIVQYRRRRRIGDELALERLELAHLSRVHQLGELSGAFAHELNQPLTSIMANAEVGARLLRKEPADTQELAAIFEDIVTDDKRAAAIIAQLRSLMVKGEAKLDPVDLNDTIESTITLANSELVARQTRVSFDDRQKEIRVRGNVAQLQQLILNLVLNAAEAMSDMPVADRRVEIETRKREDGSCEMAVSDRGPGISPELKSKVFKPFVSSKEKGLGLGLAICRSIALAHGGTLRFDDSRETGARVVLTLPSF